MKRSVLTEVLRLVKKHPSSGFTIIEKPELSELFEPHRKWIDGFAIMGMNRIDRTFLRKSPPDLAIFKLVAHVTGLMLAYPEMRAYPEAAEAREKGLSSSQIRYLFRSYPEKGKILSDKGQRLAFLDEARKNIIRLGIIDQEILDKPLGWSKQVTNKHLVGLMETQGLVRVNRRYKIVQDPHYYNHAFPMIFKSMIRSIPVSWMIPRTDKVVTTLAYLRPRTELIKSGPMKETFKMGQKKGNNWRDTEAVS